MPKLLAIHIELMLYSRSKVTYAENEIDLVSQNRHCKVASSLPKQLILRLPLPDQFLNLRFSLCHGSAVGIKRKPSNSLQVGLIFQSVFEDRAVIDGRLLSADSFFKLWLKGVVRSF